MSPAYTIAVRALCEFTARQGDLDLRFTPSPTAQEGMAGHATVAARRGSGYVAELPLAGDFTANGQTLHVRGRADGFDAARLRLEEIKTHRGPLDTQPENHRHLHWAQARVYGHLLCAAQGLPQLEIALVYLDVGTERETVLAEIWQADDLRRHFEDQCQRFLAWATQEARHRAARDEALTALRFPHPDFRTGQRPLAEAVYKAATHRRCLLAQAPTGIGKTIGTLFPLLKACTAQGIDKVFYLSAKTSGRQLALDALDQLHPSGEARAPWRVLELVARDKACEHPDKACHGDACPLAQGFYDRLPQARQAAIDSGRPLDKAQVRNVAAAHSVCPYYLGQELARWADIVVGDYNHYFDLHAMLFSLGQTQQWRVAALVDEAHNLLDRARGMYSSELSHQALRTLRRTAPSALKRPLERVHRLWLALVKDQQADYQAHAEPPFSLVQALQHAVGAITDHLTEHPQATTDTALQGFYFDALQFTRVAELFDEHSMFDVRKAPAPPGSRGKPDTVLCLRNIVPAPFLAPRWASLHTATLFSATVQPWNYQLDTLGLPQDTACIDLPTPFDARQLQVHVAQDLSTRFKDRGASLAPMVSMMARHYKARPGNYLAFFSSFDYLRQAADTFEAEHPAIPVWRQSRGMREEEQRDFLARFNEGGQGIGFAVLGGAFAEGVDLPGRRLVGAFIATLGLPQFNPVNEEICHRLQRLFGARLGHDYTYLYPGLQKVVQAAGRVIRTPQDEGVVVLMDERFSQPHIRRLLPTWWATPRHA